MASGEAGKAPGACTRRRIGHALRSGGRAMTEAEWLMPGDLRAHVEFQAARQQARRLRLFSVACCRQLEPWMDEPKLFEALARAERVADGELSDSTIAKWRRKVNQLERDRL